MKRLLSALFAIGITLAGYAQTDKLPNNARSTPIAGYLVNASDTTGRQFWLNYGSRFSDRVARYPELLRSLVVSQNYAKHYADSLDVLYLRKSGGNTVNGDQNIKGTVTAPSFIGNLNGSLTTLPDGSGGALTAFGPNIQNTVNGWSKIFLGYDFKLSSPYRLGIAINQNDPQWIFLADGLYETGTGYKAYFGPAPLIPGIGAGQARTNAGNDTTYYPRYGNPLNFYKPNDIAAFSGLVINGTLNLLPQTIKPAAPASGNKIYADAEGGTTLLGVNGKALTLSKKRLTADRKVYVQNKDYTLGDSADIAVNAVKVAINKAQITADSIRINGKADTASYIKKAGDLMTGGLTNRTSLAVGVNGLVKTATSGNAQGVHEGIAVGGANAYLIGIANLFRTDTATYQTVAASNATPFSGLPSGINHLGDGKVYNGLLYVPAENYGGCGSVSGQVIAKYDATTLTLSSYFTVTANTTEAGSVAIDAANNALYIGNYCTGEIYRYNLSTEAYVSKFSTGILGIQGIKVVGGLLYASNNQGIYSVNVADGSNQQLIYAAAYADKVVEGFDVVNGQVKLLTDVSNNQGTSYVVTLSQGSTPAAYYTDKLGNTKIAGKLNVGDDVQLNGSLQSDRITVSSGGQAKFTGNHFGSSTYDYISSNAAGSAWFGHNQLFPGSTQNDATKGSGGIFYDVTNSRMAFGVSPAGTSSTTYPFWLTYTGVPVFNSNITFSGSRDIATAATPANNIYGTTLFGTTVGTSGSPISTGNFTALNVVNGIFSTSAKLGTFFNLTASGVPGAADGNIYYSGVNVKLYKSAESAWNRFVLTDDGNNAGDVLYGNGQRFVRFNGSGLFKLNGSGAPTIAVAGTDYLAVRSQYAITSAATLVYTGDYVFSGSSNATLTLPAIAAATKGDAQRITIYNKSAVTLTINSSAGSNDIYQSGPKASFTLAGGGACTLVPDGSSFLYR